MLSIENALDAAGVSRLVLPSPSVSRLIAVETPTGPGRITYDVRRPWSPLGKSSTYFGQIVVGPTDLELAGDEGLLDLPHGSVQAFAHRWAASDMQNNMPKLRGAEIAPFLKCRCRTCGLEYQQPANWWHRKLRASTESRRKCGHEGCGGSLYPVGQVAPLPLDHVVAAAKHALMTGEKFRKPTYGGLFKVGESPVDPADFRALDALETEASEKFGETGVAYVPFETLVDIFGQVNEGGKVTWDSPVPNLITVVGVCRPIETGFITEDELYAEAAYGFRGIAKDSLGSRTEKVEKHKSKDNTRAEKRRLYVV